MVLRFFGSLVFIAFFSISASFSYAVEVQKAAEFVLCKNQKTVRTIRVMPENNDASCSITYSKSGVEEIVGANRSMSSCKSILAHIRENLESSKWNCHNVSSAIVTESHEVTR